MMANTWYTVISPESCSSILWRSWDHKEKAAEELKLTSDHMLNFGLVDGVIPEPIGGAHWDHDEAAMMLKQQIIEAINELKDIDPENRIETRRFMCACANSTKNRIITIITLFICTYRTWSFRLKIK
jgi:acetyl-CoA carboxylase carboxyl transferase subunit alpha